MSDWLQGEADRLEKRWTGVPKSMPGACPNCHHPDAFKAIAVYPYSSYPSEPLAIPDRSRAGPGGDGGPAEVTKEEESAKQKEAAKQETAAKPADVFQFPSVYDVRCACANKEHEPGTGCGRAGWIAIPNQKVSK